ncbi:MAG: enoyl-CoA hydratase/isomerase family protein [Sphingomonadales bacterium]|nr:enoyl-CoA hydratase/isomerase family protein [Sphingomonadales bacterium]
MSEILAFVEGSVARLRLNRPKAIHALNEAMCRAMSEVLLQWRDDPGVEAVILDHAEGRGFCAGGDVVTLAKSGAADGAEAARFFAEEYRLNHLLFTYPKPIVAMMDGITMGGGVGIALPCRYRVATENTRFAMPETTIGLFPDVGGGWYLSRLEARVGQFLALTGARLDGAECHDLKLATHFVASADLPALIERIVAVPARIEGALGAASSSPGDARITANLPAIGRLFAADGLEEILTALDADGSDWAATEAATIRTKSPLSCKISLRLLADGARRADFTAEMVAEHALASHIVRTHDFLEGVRALLIDKDNAPHWDPPTPDGVTDAMLDRLFAPAASGEQWTPFPEVMA